MKKLTIPVLIVMCISIRCEKDVAHRGDLSSAATSIKNNVVSPVTVVTFNPVLPLRTITTKTHDIIFSDSLYITDDEAILQTLKFNVQGKNLFFSNYAFFINGARWPVIGDFQSGILTISFDKTISLPINNYYKIEVRAKVTCPQQLFTVSLQQSNVSIVNYYYGTAAVVYGLPLSYSIRALKY